MTTTGAACHGGVATMSDDGDVGNDMALQPIGNGGGGGCAMAKYEI